MPWTQRNAVGSQKLCDHELVIKPLAQAELSLNPRSAAITGQYHKAGSYRGLPVLISPVITAFYAGNGVWHLCPRLPGYYKFDEDKLLILIHELPHRLLGGKRSWYNHASNLRITSV